MSGVLEQVLETLKRIEAKIGSGEVAATETPAPAVAAGASTDKPARGRGRPAGSTKAAETPAPKVETAASVGSDSSFLDDEPVEKATKDQVRAALVAFNKKVNSEQKTRELLKTAGGVDNLSALPEDKYAAVIAAANKA